MKKKIFLSILVAGTITLGSCNHEPDFPGVDELSQPTNVAKYAVTYVGAAFTAEQPAKETLPTWLKDKFYTCDKGSVAAVNYKYIQSVPDYVTAVSSAEVMTLSPDNYQTIWAPNTLISCFSPSNPATRLMPKVLAKAISAPEDGMLTMVAYNQADRDGTKLFTDFESNTLSGWINVNTIGSFKWQVKNFDDNHYVQQSAYNHKDGALESYLISSEPVAIESGMVLTFDALYANYVATGGRISVVLLSNLSQFTPTGVTNATKEGTLEFDIATSNNNSGDLVPVVPASLDGYNGKTVYIAFKYEGNSDKQTTTARIDNITIKSRVPINYQKSLALYKYADGKWSVYPDVEVLPPSAYDAIGEYTLSPSAALASLPVYLSSAYPYAASGTVKAIAFKTTDGYMASEFQKNMGNWISTSDPVELTDEYEYDGSEWVYVRTVPKAALNETFDDKIITDNDKTALDGWINKSIQGESSWVDKKYSGNNYVQCSAYGLASGSLDAWLITPALEIKSNYVLKFDMVSGYWTHDALHVYVSTDFSGKEDDIANAKWTEITKEFEMPKNESGYSKFAPVGSYKMDSYVGQKVYVAFKYLGDKDKGETSTVQLDNIYVGE